MAKSPDKKSPQAGANKEKPTRTPGAPKEAAGDGKAEKAPAPERPARAQRPEKGAPAEARAEKPAAAPAGDKPARAPRQQQAAGAAPAQRGGGGKAAAPAAKAAERPAMPREPTRLLIRYREQVVPVLRREFGYTNPMQAPRLRKVSLNIGMGEALKSQGAIDAAAGDITAITGQKPVVTKARKSVANFGLREGQAIGVMITLRGARMWQFMDRLMNIALPRVRDFRGVPRNAFDGRGNYTLGMKEQVVFPEIDYNKIDRLRGLQINVITSARTDEEGRRLLELLGMPFVRPDQPAAARR